MTQPTEEYNEASTLLERLLTQDFSLIADMYCEQIADQLYEDFMKDRHEEDSCCVVNDVEQIKKTLLSLQSQINIITKILENLYKKEKSDDNEQKEFEDCMKRLGESLGIFHKKT